MGEEDGGEGLGEDAGEGRAPGGLGRLLAAGPLSTTARDSVRA